MNREERDDPEVGPVVVFPTEPTRTRKPIVFFFFLNPLKNARRAHLQVSGYDILGVIPKKFLGDLACTRKNNFLYCFLVNLLSFKKINGLKTRT